MKGEYVTTTTRRRRTQVLAAGDLGFDDELLELRPLDAPTVSQYRQKLRAGADLGPLAVNRRTMLVADGNHRLRALLDELGPEHMVAVHLLDLPTQVDVLKVFAAENSKHGLPLSSWSRRRIVRRLLDHRVTVDEISRLFGVCVTAVERWKDQGISVVRWGNGRTTEVPMKRGPEVSRTITERQYQDHCRHDRGISIGALVNQLVGWLDRNWVAGSSRNISRMQRLRSSIDRWLEKHG